MIQILIFTVLLSLVVYRLTRFLISDILFDPVRDRFWKIFPPKNQFLKFKPRGDSFPVIVDGNEYYTSVNGSFIGELTSCTWCLSAYVSVASVTLSQFAGVAFDVVGLSFVGWALVTTAVWGLSCILLNKFAGN